MKTSKFNKSQILKKAWSLVRNNGYKLANAMRVSWQYAKNKITESATAYKGDAERIFNLPVNRFNGDKLAALKATLVRGRVMLDTANLNLPDMGDEKMCKLFELHERSIIKIGVIKKSKYYTIFSTESHRIQDMIHAKKVADRIRNYTLKQIIS